MKYLGLTSIATKFWLTINIFRSGRPLRAGLLSGVIIACSLFLLPTHAVAEDSSSNDSEEIEVIKEILLIAGGVALLDFCLRHEILEECAMALALPLLLEKYNQTLEGIVNNLGN